MSKFDRDLDYHIEQHEKEQMSLEEKIKKLIQDYKMGYMVMKDIMDEIASDKRINVNNNHQYQFCYAQYQCYRTFIHNLEELLK